MTRDTSSSPPDGGWGWIVVVAVFVGNILIDGTISTFGLFYPYVMSEFGSNPALTSLTGSLIPAVYMTSAPLAGILIHRYDCRRVSIAGGIFAASGFVLASQSRTIVVFAIAYGVLGGLGIGMNSLCGHLMVNTYFSKKRGIVYGIVSSGAGVGVFILAPLLQDLLGTYSWRGAMLIYSGLLLQYCVCGMLLRPFQLPDTDAIVDREDKITVCETVEDNNNETIKSDTRKLLLPEIQGPFMDEDKSTEFMYLQTSKHLDPFHLKKHASPVCNISYITADTIKVHSLPDMSHFQDENSLLVQAHTTFKLDKPKIKPAASDNAFLIIHDDDYVEPKFLKPLNRKDILFSSSIFSLKEYKKSEHYNSFVNEMTIDTPESKSDKNCEVDCENTATRIIDCSVFRNRVYVPVLLGGIFVQMGQFIPSTFLPNYCLSLGLTNTDVTTIISVYGVMNILGRLVAGVLANIESISTLWLCTFGNLMCGVTCALFPFCKSLVSLCVFAAGFGCFIGYFGPLQVLIMVEYLGLEKLTSAMGILQLAKGPAALFGPPMAGLVYEWTRDYSTAMLVASSMFILSSAFQSTVPLINRVSR